MFGGITSYGVTFYTGTAISHWRILYIIMGGCAFVVGALVLLFLPDSIATASFLTEREKVRPSFFFFSSSPVLTLTRSTGRRHGEGTRQPNGNKAKALQEGSSRRSVYRPQDLVRRSSLLPFHLNTVRDPASTG